MSKLTLEERIRIALQVHKEQMLQHNGRPDCKNCALAEVIEKVLEKSDD